MPFLLVLGIGFVLIGLTYITLILVGRQRQTPLGHWPTTVGTVEASYVHKREPRPSQAQPKTYTPVVIFSYPLDGETYVAKQRTFAGAGAHTTRDLIAAETVVKKYPAESSVTVYYNPHAPSQAVLEPEKPTGYNTSLFVNVGNVVLGGLIILVYALLV
ncbi:MAG: DUF3592 domain-containing protein [Anaerolineae bacterium]